MAGEEKAAEIINFEVDGKVCSCEKDILLIKALEQNGYYVPRFCYHPYLKPVGMCRACLVEVEGPRGFTLMPSCFIKVAPDMKVNVENESVRKVHEAILEFLLINHPLDCPVCDRGGECPLQDQTLHYGPGESRFLEEKRHFEKPIEISPLIYLDRERCIQCGRCVRFADEIAGEALIDFFSRGASLEVNIFEDKNFDSYFSLNIVEICPVGALTSRPYRFAARPWDLEQAESTCLGCSVQCRVSVQSSENRITRLLAVDVPSLNQLWLCDKGRLCFEALESDKRILAPCIKNGNNQEKTSWAQAISRVAEILSEARVADGPSSIAFLGGAMLTNEDAYVFTKLAKSVIGTDNIDPQFGDGFDPLLLQAIPRATVEEAINSKAVVVIGADLKEQLPILYLRIRNAVENNNLCVYEFSNYKTSLTKLALASYKLSSLVSLALEPNSERITEIRDILNNVKSEDGKGVTFIVSRDVISQIPSYSRLLFVLAKKFPKAKFIVALKRSNIFGALDMGLCASLLPGRVSFEEGKKYFSKHWAKVPDFNGLSASQILDQVISGSIKTLIVLGNDLINDFPFTNKAKAAIEKVDNLIYIGALNNETYLAADVVLPSLMWGEKEGLVTNFEGRVSYCARKVTGPLNAWPDWQIAQAIAQELGEDFAYETQEDVFSEISSTVPLYKGLSYQDLEAFRDGIIIPLRGEKIKIRSKALDPIASVSLKAINSQGPLKYSINNKETSFLPQVDDRNHLPSTISLASISPNDLDLDFFCESLDNSQGAFRIYSKNKLYDKGELIQNSKSLAPLSKGGPKLFLNEKSINELNISPGDTLKISFRDTKKTFGGVKVAVDNLIEDNCCVLEYKDPEKNLSEAISSYVSFVNLSKE